MDRPVIHGGCHLRMPVRKDDQPGSGCRVDCLHRAAVLAFRAERAAWEEWAKVAREQATWTDLDEGASWAERNPGPTLLPRKA